MNHDVPFTQVRIARPTDRLEKIISFYTAGLGLAQIGRFHDHAGVSGVMLGMPDKTCHLEFTQHSEGSPCHPPTKDNLLVFYYRNAGLRNVVAERLRGMGYGEATPHNPYWVTHGITIEDPDGWRIVLMSVPGFEQAG